MFAVNGLPPHCPLWPPLVSCRGRLLAFKALMAGAPVAASINSSATAKGLSSGTYTMWQDVGNGIGASQTAIAAATLQDCLTACDIVNSCAGVVLEASATITATTTLTSCKLVAGDSTVGSLKRSMTKVVTSRLAVQGELGRATCVSTDVWHTLSFSGRILVTLLA